MMRVVVLLGCCLGLIGCGGTPQAPALRDTPVYQNKSAGFRFLVPQGWNQMATANVPDNLEQEFLLTRYRLSTSPQGAMFEVMCLEPKEGFDAIQYHAGPSHGAKSWAIQKDDKKNKEAAAPRSRHGDRSLYSAAISGKATIKEVINVSRGKRVFSFIGLYGPSDSAAQEEIRRAVESIQWED